MGIDHIESLVFRDDLHGLCMVFHWLFLCYWVCIVLFHSIGFYVVLDLPLFLGNFVLLWVMYLLECL